MKIAQPILSRRHGWASARAPWLLALLTLSLALAKPAQAQETADMIQTSTLENGLQVIAIADPGLPIVTVEMAVKNGAFTETPELNGLSHLYEHMFFKANAVIPNQHAYMKRMRELGIVFNGTTSTERVNYFFTLPADNLKAGLTFMFDAITTTRFDEAEFTAEKQVVIGEVDRNESNPYYWFSQALQKKLWYEYPSRKDPLGDRGAITNATIQQMQTMKDRYYVPNNSALLIAGDVPAERAFALAEEIFGGWERAADPFEKWPVPSPPALTHDSFLVVERDVEMPYIQFNWHGPSVTEDPQATFAADVLSFILSQPTSGFQKRLVDSGLTLGAGLSYYTQAYVGPISLSAQMTPEQVEPAVRAMLAEIRKLADPAYFSDAQLQNAKTILAVRDIYEREKTSSFAHTLSFWWATADLDYYLNYIDNLKAVTRDDIADYVQKYILGKHYVMGILLSPAQKQELGLSDAALAEMVERIQQELGAHNDAATGEVAQ